MASDHLKLRHAQRGGAVFASDFMQCRNMEIAGLPDDCKRWKLKIRNGHFVVIFLMFDNGAEEWTLRWREPGESIEPERLMAMNRRGLKINGDRGNETAVSIARTAGHQVVESAGQEANGDSP